MHKVEIEFKRIQNYLFASPRLRAMLGANAALGRTVRIELTALARECGAEADPAVASQMPCLDAKDPLAQLSLTDTHTLIDDPSRIYREYGVLVRDGGHFIATFPSPAQAQRFIDRAHENITSALPGILIEARLDGKMISCSDVAECRFQHPAFQVSHHLGNRPAENRGAKDAFVSSEEKMMENFGAKFRQQPTDLIALLETSRLIPCPEEPPRSLSDLSDGNYLALIHADGNGMGQRYKSWRKLEVDKPISLTKEAHGERFFHSMRVAVRRALVQAIHVVFGQSPGRYQLLMLGGDDLLLACAASYALPFVLEYARALDEIPLCDQKPLSIGAGVVIAKESFPFHRLHAMAETLADSAKQRYRADPSLGSVVDWHITSSAWVDDPIAERQSNSLTANSVLSGKPFPVLGAGSLEYLLTEAEKISKAPDVARSQLRDLVGIMRQGGSLAELAWREIPAGTRIPLEIALKSFPQEGLFRHSGAMSISVLPDLVEIFEIQHQKAKEHH